MPWSHLRQLEQVRTKHLARVQRSVPEPFARLAGGESGFFFAFFFPDERTWLPSQQRYESALPFVVGSLKHHCRSDPGMIEFWQGVRSLHTMSWQFDAPQDSSGLLTAVGISVDTLVLAEEDRAASLRLLMESLGAHLESMLAIGRLGATSWALEFFSVPFGSPLDAFCDGPEGHQ